MNVFKPQTVCTMSQKSGLSVIILAIFLYCLPGHATALDTLLPNERNTIDIFQKISPKVVYVHRMTKVINRAHQSMHVVPAGTGSGIVWDNKGHIVTNYHVVHDADALAVTIGDTTVPVKVIGAEPRKDLAVLLIESPNILKLLQSYTPFDIAPMHELLVGQTAIAIGNPFGFDHSLSVGVISSLGRQVPGIGGVTIHNMIQTDAAINPGNSGGPLLDSSGRLIGLNTVIFSQSGTSAGVGFAVPADDIMRTVTQIIKHGRVRLAGIGIQPVEPTLAKRLGIEQGILIADVLPNTPAAQAKLRSTYRDGWGRIHLGDVIVAVNGHPVANYDELYNILCDVKIGTDITLTVYRDHMQIYHHMKTIDIAGI